MQILAACGEAVVELHIHQADIRLHAKAEVLPLIRDAGLKCYVAVLDLRLAVERTVGLGVYIVGVVVGAEREHGAEAKHKIILGMIAGHERYFDEFERIVICTLISICLDGTLHVYAIGHARHYREPLGKPIGHAIAEPCRQAIVVVECRSVQEQTYRKIYTVFPLSLLCRSCAKYSYEQQQCHTDSFHDKCF